MATDLITQLHDKLLEFQPSGANHPDDCPICAGDGTPCDHLGGDMSTFTQEDIDAAVAQAIKPLQDELSSLKNTLTQTEAEEAFASEKAALETKIAELQVQLDAAVLDATQAKTEIANMVAFLEDAVATAEAEETAKAKKAARTEKMKTYAFTDEQIEERAERWAAMDDAEFDAYMADLEALGAPKKSEDTSDRKIPQDTAMDNAGDKKPSDTRAAMREVLSLKQRGIDPATVRSL